MANSYVSLPAAQFAQQLKEKYPQCFHPDGGGTIICCLNLSQPPRGRVVCDTMDQRFTLLADKCILRDKRIVREIISSLSLPAGTLTSRDSHYQCFRCLGYVQDKGDED